MSAKGNRRGTRAYGMGVIAFKDGAHLCDADNPYLYGDNYRAWREGWADAKAEYDQQQAREPDDRMREMLNTIRRSGDDVPGATELVDAIADAIELIWEKLK